MAAITPKVITLITDFGWDDAYVGQLKGRLLQGCAHILPIDISHTIPPWDITAASRCLCDSYSFFPPGSIHLVVVDPGVGSARRLVAARGDGHYFVAPDNGILTGFLHDGRIEQAYALDIPGDASTISHTFHGRDILAPAASRLACGHPLETLGQQLPLDTLVRLAEQTAVSSPAPSDNTLSGKVLTIDHFGNIRTSLHPQRNNFDASHLSALSIKNIVITQQVNSYSDTTPGNLCFLIDSGGYLEIAINQGNAAHTLSCRPGDMVQLYFKTRNR